jgi:proline iminopeptidase
MQNWGPQSIVPLALRRNYLDGYAGVLGYNLYYKIFGNKKSVRTLLCLHGGPGMTHDYILPLSDLSDNGYRVVFYDQLGCGNSDLPKNNALFNVERAVEEVETFRTTMELGKVNLFGSSWGGLLAIAYALKYQRNLKSLILAGAYPNVPFALEEMERLKSHLPPETRKTMKKYEDLGDYENPEYLDSIKVFYQKHFCRLSEWPAEINYSLDHVSKPVYYTMNGPNEFTIIGNTRYWNVSEELPKIRVRTLVTGGRYDEMTPNVAEDIHKRIKGSKLVIFEKSAHVPFWEEREKYIDTVLRFLENN